MKKFTFGLQKVLNLREFDESQAKEELGRVISIANKLNLELEHIAKERVSARKSSGTIFNASEFIAIENYVNRLDLRKDEVIEELVQTELLIEEKRKIFAEAMKNRKVISKLKEKQMKDWKKRALKEEELFVDDVINTKFLRENV